MCILQTWIITVYNAGSDLSNLKATFNPLVLLTWFNYQEEVLTIIEGLSERNPEESLPDCTKHEGPSIVRVDTTTVSECLEAQRTNPWKLQRDWSCCTASILRVSWRYFAMNFQNMKSYSETNGSLSTNFILQGRMLSFLHDRTALDFRIS